MFTVIPALPEHAEQIQDVFYHTWLATYPGNAGITVEDVEKRFADRLSEEKLAKRREELENPHPGHHVLVALHEEKVVGVCRLETGTGNRIKAIYVLPEYQGKGIGRQLWEKAKEYCDETKETHVAVATFNTSAIAFYTKLGFVDTGRRFTEERLRMESGAEIPQMDMVLKDA